MNAKILSINLWYEKYGNKTRAQLKSFRNAGFKTHVATITDGLHLFIYDLSDANTETILSEQFTSYKAAFDCLFSFCIKENYSVIYIRRLMSKLFYALPYIKKTAKSIPIVYEIPTYPLDTGNSFLYAVRDFLEFGAYKLVNPSIKLTLVNLIAEKKIPSSWQIFHNGIDIDNYDIPGAIPKCDTFRFIMVANISEYHHYERMLYAMDSYNKKSGSSQKEKATNGLVPSALKIHLTVISPKSNAYDSLKLLSSELNLDSQIDFLDSMPLSDIQKIADNCHVGVGQLSNSSKGSNLVNTLKSKDYCAMGIPFFSTCYDTSFEKEFPYAYVTKDMDSDIDLEGIIRWYKDIAKDNNYKNEMYNYAKKNLQYDKLVNQVISVIDTK